VKRDAKITLDENFEEAKMIEFQMNGCKESHVSLVKKEAQAPHQRGIFLTTPLGK
jgi:hypothetical protein